MKNKDIFKLAFAVSKVLFAILVVCFAGTNGFLYTQAYFTLGVTGTSLPSQTGYWGPPTVVLLSPNGSGSLYQGNNYSINWNATASSPSGDPITIGLYYSTDGGATYPNTIATGEANDGIYNWTVPNIFSSTVKVKVVATDAHAQSASDDSNANFSVVSPIVLNEFLPNPFGVDNAPKPAGEWVELRNNGAVPMDVNNWVIYDATDTGEIVISATNSDNNGNPTDAGETTVPAGGFLVVYRNGDSDFEMNNTVGDSVRLFNNRISLGGTLIDSYTYTGDAPENKSYARIPDGFGAFVDPIPTPGKPNEIGNYLDTLLLPGVLQSTSTPTPDPLFTLPTILPTPTETPLPTATSSATTEPTPTILPVSTEVPTVEPTATPTEAPTPTVEPSVTPEPSPTTAVTPSETSTPAPTESPIPTQ